MYSKKLDYSYEVSPAGGMLWIQLDCLQSNPALFSIHSLFSPCKQVMLFKEYVTHICLQICYIKNTASLSLFFVMLGFKIKKILKYDKADVCIFKCESCKNYKNDYLVINKLSIMLGCTDPKVMRSHSVKEFSKLV